MFIGELSVLDNFPFWHFDEEFCKWHISNHNLKREQKAEPLRLWAHFICKGKPYPVTTA